MTEKPATPPRLANFVLPAISLPGFSADHEFRGTELVVHLRGNADSDSAVAFERYLEQMHVATLRAGLHEVTLDFHELYFLTSSCIKCLVQAIKRVTELEPPAQYKINLATQPSRRWQERSFDVLRKLAPHLVRVTPT